MTKVAGVISRTALVLLRKRSAILLLLCISALLDSVPLAWAESYTFTTFAVPDRYSTYAYGINNVGQIVGDVDHGLHGSPGFVLTDGVFQLFNLPGYLGTHPMAINDVGQIVGYVDFNDSFQPPSHGFLEANGAITLIDVPGAAATMPLGINNAGEIIGTFYTPDAPSNLKTFLYRNGTFTIFNFYGTAINNIGQIVGPGFLYTEGVITPIPEFDPEPPSRGRFRPTGINDAGQIVGVTQDRSTQTATLYSNGVFTYIFELPVSADEHTFAQGINDAGQIVGYYAGSTGYYGFLATPTTVPEPTSFALLAAGLAGIGTLIWRKQSSL